MSAQCAIWSARTDSNARVNSGDRFEYDCPRAGGKYQITGSAKQVVGGLSDWQKAYLTSWLMDQRRGGNEVPLVTAAELERAKMAGPKTLPERRDGLLRAVSVLAPILGQTVRYTQIVSPWDEPIESPYWAEYDYLLAATESVGIDEVDVLAQFAIRQNFLAEEDTAAYSLTFDGYSHLETLKGAAQDSLQAFVAMWFGSEVSDAYDQGIAPAISDAGYKPMRIDQKEHSNKIDDEIIAEIRRSRFLVADFTCGLVDAGGSVTAIPRGGVYYEAGFAQGLGIPVIWCCRADHINHVHFDTRQFNHITWTTPEELREKLRNRIGAVLGDGPLLNR